MIPPIRLFIGGIMMASALGSPALGQDATRFAPPGIAWTKPSAAYADSAGTAQRVDPDTLGACGAGEVLTLSANGTFVCTNTVANASYAGDAGTVGGKTADQIADMAPGDPPPSAPSGCNTGSIPNYHGSNRGVGNGGVVSFASSSGCNHYVYKYLCVSGSWSQIQRTYVDDCD